MLLSTTLFSALQFLTLISASSFSNRSYHRRDLAADVAILQNGVNALIATINADIQAAVAALGRGPSTSAAAGYIQVQYAAGTEMDRSAFYYIAYQPPGFAFPNKISAALPFSIASTDGTCKGIGSGLVNIGSPLSHTSFWGAYNTDASSSSTSQVDIDFSMKSSAITEYNPTEYYETQIWSLVCPVAPAKTSAVLSVTYGNTKYVLCAESSSSKGPTDPNQDASQPPKRLFASTSCTTGIKKGIPVIVTFIATSPKF